MERASFPDPYDRSIFAHFLLTESDGFLVAESSEAAIIGYVVSTTRMGEAGEGIIASIAVESGRQREGVGTVLLSSAISYLRRSRVKHVYLQVSVNNEAALGLYHRFGFQEAGRIRGYYPNGDDAYVMTLNLAP